MPWNNLHQVQFNLLGSLLFGKVKSSGQPLDMGVYNNAARRLKRIPEYDVCGFSADSSELSELLEGFRHFSFVLLYKCACAGLEVLRLRPVKPGGTDDGLKLWQRNLHVVAGGFTPFEKSLCNLIYPQVRALSG